MPCDTQLKPNQTLKQRNEEVDKALKKLEQELERGRARVVIGPNGAVFFQGWDDRSGVNDACAYRVLSAQNSVVLRRAVARAEAMSGKRVNPTAVAAGYHTHDGKNWDKH